MNCKNCHTELSTKDDYCKSCGGKVIRNRLTFRNLFEHLSETFFNYDNKLLRTFIRLFTRPEDVVGDYIEGVRKKYVNPISYLGIALTLTGIIIYLMKKNQLEVNYDVFNQGMNQNYMTKIQSLTTEYASLIFISYIPLLVAASWLILKKRNYNITERTVAFTYLMAQYSITSIIPSIFILIIVPQAYMTYSIFALTFLILYLLWSLFRISKIHGLEFIGQIMVFLSFFGVLYIFYILGLMIIALLTGLINFEDFRPN
ncbi:DUF3667 domain-containing protein [Winogradskyella helgolandensis]|uniref:DUF3667 domain-containing protein n=1 Tax=Winogradskyella helgolandensis TaxID=2697010 RepID=UPI0015C18827|nr:DUF3667 domain-containing protein [Winogradskyella helgolandensis]